MATETEIKATKEIRPLKDETLALTDLFRKDMTIDSATGVITMAADSYEKNMPASITKEQVIELQKYNTNVAAAVTNAMGQLSLATMTKNKKLESTELEMATIGKDTISVTFRKQAEVSAGASADAGKKIVFGQTAIKFDMHARGNRGELAKVKEHLAIEAKSLFT
jgi:hypothetical protein